MSNRLQSKKFDLFNNGRFIDLLVKRSSFLVQFLWIENCWTFVKSETELEKADTPRDPLYLPLNMLRWKSLKKECKEKHFREMNYHGFCMCKKPIYGSQQKAYLSIQIYRVYRRLLGYCSLQKMLKVTQK